MPTITAQQILDENGWLATDITLTNLEYLLDNAINYINLEAGLSISNLTGVAESKTMTSTSAQDPIIKGLTSLFVRAYLEKGPNIGISALNVAQITTDPHYKIYMMIIKRGIKRLIGVSFERA